MHAVDDNDASFNPWYARGILGTVVDYANGPTPPLKIASHRAFEVWVILTSIHIAAGVGIYVVPW